MSKQAGQTAIGRRGAILGLAAVGLLLTGCGRRSTPKASEDSTYERTQYPTRSGMGLPEQDPLQAPLPAESDIEKDTPVPGAYSAPPRGLGY